MKNRFPIDEHHRLAINGTTLDMRIRGTKSDNPVLLFLHGGPGVCDRHFVLEDQAPLADVCTIVCFDQRGAGKSYTPAQAKQHMDTEQVLEDAIAVIDWLRVRFSQEKVYLVGHSYGSYLGVLLCSRIPEKIAAYVGMGQLVNGAENERISYEFVQAEATKKNDQKALAALDRIGAPVDGFYKSLDDLTIQRNLMTKFGGAAHGKKQGMISSMVLPILRSPEYSLFDIAGYAKGAYYNLRELWREVIASKFDQSVTRFTVPVFITQGKHDQNTPPELAKAWLESLDAPRKEWICFEESAHSPAREETEKWNQVIRNRVIQ